MCWLPWWLSGICYQCILSFGTPINQRLDVLDWFSQFPIFSPLLSNSLYVCYSFWKIWFYILTLLDFFFSILILKLLFWLFILTRWYHIPVSKIQLPSLIFLRIFIKAFKVFLPYALSVASDFVQFSFYFGPCLLRWRISSNVWWSGAVNFYFKVRYQNAD